MFITIVGSTDLRTFFFSKRPFLSEPKLSGVLITLTFVHVPFPSSYVTVFFSLS